MATATAQRVHTFISSGTDYRLRRRPTLAMETLGGAKQITQTGIVIEFVEGRLEVAAGHQTLPDGPGGQPQDLVSWLRGHRSFGRRFYELGANGETEVLEPTPRDFRSGVLRAMGQFDEDALRGMIDAERNTHCRQELIDHAEEALEQIGAAVHDVTSGEAA